MVGTWSNRRPCGKSLNPTGGLGALGTCQQAFRCISINYHKLVNHRAMINTPHLLLASDSSSRRGGGEGNRHIDSHQGKVAGDGTQPAAVWCSCAWVQGAL